MAKKNITNAELFLTIPCIVLLACVTLFSLDKDTHSFGDLLKPGNLVALFFYFTPTLIISLFFFRLFSNKYARAKSTILSLATGIPLSFTLVICFFLFIKH